MSGSTLHRIAVSVCLLILAFTTAADAQRWSRAFGAMGLDHHSGDGEAYCLGEYQGKLVVGGWFEEAGDEVAMHIALWDGERWEALAGGVNQIPAFAVGTPFSLYVGGPFWQVDGEPWAYCARWDGTWHEMPGLVEAPTCATMVNQSLWVGGSFSVDEPPYYPVGMKRWFAGNWEPPAQFGNWDLWQDEAHAIADGYESIHLGGDIMRVTAGDTCWSHVGWRYDEGGVQYGRGLEGGDVECFAPAMNAGLWIGGSFSHADGHVSHGLVLQGSGGTYFPVAGGATDREVSAMTIHGPGPHMTIDEGTPTEDLWVVRMYNNSAWSDPLGGQFTDGLKCIESLDGDLYVGGFFKNGIVRWDDEEWVQLGGGIGVRHHDRHWFKALVEFDGDVIAAGEDIKLPTAMADQIDCENVVRWDGDAWHRLGKGLGPDVSSLAVYHETLYAGLPSGEASLQRLQRWDGDAWHDAADFNGQVLCLIVYEDYLVAGGRFTEADGVTVGRVAAFDGVQWHALGTGMDDVVQTLFVNDGVLYAGGGFTTADGAPAARIARWNGVAWSAMGAGFDDGDVHAVSAYNDEIFAGGSFTMSNGAPRHHVARWDGAAWQPLGDGVSGDTFYGVSALRGTTSGLYVGGDFTSAGGSPAGGIAYWDGAWSPFAGEGVSDPYFARATVSDLLVHEGDLWVGGHFTRAADVPSYCIALWEDGTLVPNLLSRFDATPRDDGSVSLSWQVAPSLAEAEFRLTAAVVGASWDVAFSRPGPTQFTARDASPGLAGAHGVHYALSYAVDGRWHDLAETRVQLVLPAAVRLLSVAPNPFNPATQVRFEVDHAQDVRLEVYDLAGRRVATVAADRFDAGRHLVTWQGCDDAGRALPSGAYVVRLATVAAVRSQKVMLAR